MENNDEKWRENFAQNDNQEENKSYGSQGRTPRPRIQRPVYGSNADGERRTFQPRNNYNRE